MDNKHNLAYLSLSNATKSAYDRFVSILHVFVLEQPLGEVTRMHHKTAEIQGLPVTPDRESDDVEPKLFTRSDFKAKTGVGSDGANSGASDPVSAMIPQGLGGKKNIPDVDCCATRLRITVVDESKVDDKLLSVQ